MNIYINDLSKYYKNKKALDHITLHLSSGIYGLIGPNGAGKTTFLNVLSNYIPVTERIVTIEDSAELQIRNVANLVRLETRNANLEGKNAVTIRDLVRSALRQRPEPHHYEIVRFRA